jgi:coenzyme F420 hydrogenase subunit delta
MIQEMFEKEILIFGCGNILMGDDGFGPAVIAYLCDNHDLPSHVMAEDIGTSIGDFLFDLILSPDKPRQIVILDAVSQPGRKPGDLFELPLSKIPDKKVGDFCMHQFPSVNLLMELDQAGVDIRILAVQIKSLPDSVGPGLSPEVLNAVPTACERLLDMITHVHPSNLKQRRYV